MATKAYPYQLKGVRKIEHFGGRALLADDMGLGKSFQSLLWTATTKFPDVKPVVIVCRASLKVNWERECFVHLGLRAEVLEGQTPPRRKSMHTANIYIINKDILHFWVKWLKQHKPKVLILDECQDYCERTNICSKAVRSLARRMKHVVALSGTPFQNRPAELWHILHILRPDIWPSNSFPAYAQRYCQPKLRRWGWEYKGAANLDELNSLLNQHVMIRRLKTDVLKELPPKVRKIVNVPLDRTARREYNAAVDDFIGWLARYNPARAKKAQRAEKMVRQGYLKRLIGELKVPGVIKWVEDFFENHEPYEKLILFGIHKQVLGPLHEHFGKMSVLVDGKITGAKRQTAIDEFCRLRKKKLFLGQNKAAGVGLNLVAARHVAVCEFGWTPGEHTQLEDRAHRIGQHRKVFAWYLSAEGTIEEKLCKVLQDKQVILSHTMDGTASGAQMNVYDLFTTFLLGSRKR